MIYNWLDELSDLIAGTTTPDVAERMGEADAADVLAHRIAWDHYEHEQDAIEAMPFFVVCETEADWRRVSFLDLELSGMLEVTYFESATQHLDLDCLNARHQASKRTYLQFIEGVMESIAQRQERSPSLISISSISLSGLPYRTPIEKRDTDRPQADYWQSTWLVRVGGGE